jgi:hypothetical protein
VGYRKTLRRNPRRCREFIDTLHYLNVRRGKRLLAPYPVRVAFWLPKSVLVADGPHGGIGINVIKGFVQVGGLSSKQCFEKAHRFLADVAGDEVLTLTASIISVERPDNKFGRFLTIAKPSVKPRMFVTGGQEEPQVYE